MNPLNVQKYILYCMGEGYFDRKRYSSDLAQHRSEDRVLQARLDQILRAIQDMSVNPQQTTTLPPIRTQAQPMLLRLMQPVLVPLQALMNMVASTLQNALQPAAQMGKLMTAVLEQATSKILSFFFGHKKDKTEEKELREKDDFEETDLFTRLTTHASSNDGGGKR